MRCPACSIEKLTPESMRGHIVRAHGGGVWKTFWEQNLAPNCKQCGKRINYRTDYQAGKRQFCSMRCAGLHNTPEGDANPNWGGGRWEDGAGYIVRGKASFTAEEFFVVEPMFGKTWSLLEHRAVKALELGRPLNRQEIVHHKNGVRSDNRPENLEVWLKGHSAGYSSNMSMRCPCCKHEGIAHDFFPRNVS